MKNAKNEVWLLDIRFLIKLLAGVAITLLVIYIITIPSILKPLYQSEVIVYTPLTILSQQLDQHGIGFGNEKETDLYIQILRSSFLADSLDKRFRLMNRYGIESRSMQSGSKLLNKLGSRIRIEKTRYGAVSVKVLDRDPKVAADMANTIIVLGEKIKKNILDPNRIESMKYARDLYEQKATELAVLSKQMDSMGNRSIHYESASRIYNLELPELIARKSRYEHKKKALDTPLPIAYVVSYAMPASGPEKPDRGLLLLLGAGLTFFTLIAIEIIKRDIRKEAHDH